MNQAIAEGDRDSLGSAKRWGGGSRASPIRDLPPRACSSRLPASVPVTVHVAFGTDTPHTHPAADPGAIGRARIATSPVLPPGFRAARGGVYLNLVPRWCCRRCSSKPSRWCATWAARTKTSPREPGFPPALRPRVNVVERPHTRSGGRGIALTGHHELLLPLLAASLIERES